MGVGEASKVRAKQRESKEKTASDGSCLSVRVRAVDAGECRYSGGSGGGVAADSHCRLMRMRRARRLAFLSDADDDDDNVYSHEDDMNKSRTRNTTTSPHTDSDGG